MKKTFLVGAPFVTEMVQAPTVLGAEYKIRNAVAFGATAIGLQLHVMDREVYDKETLTNLLSCAEDRPVYITNYRGDKNQGKSDETLMEELIKTLDSGATLLDVMGDTFCPAEDELTMDETAIKKQMELINRIHSKGGEVLMSSHVRVYKEPETVLKMALEQQRRGADIVKIVTGANSTEEELKNLEICNLLKKELKVPFLFLSNGTHNYLHRTIGPSLGVCMWLTFSQYDETTYLGPPLLSNVLKIKSGLKI
ncbi:MAG: type I 3-dehydroquinate dehydratase [Clostridia bacterium]|nr:type I 3-dehydroquinate dehydratase [Clostridia bacterium]